MTNICYIYQNEITKKVQQKAEELGVEFSIIVKDEVIVELKKENDVPNIEKFIEFISKVVLGTYSTCIRYEYV